MSSIDQRVVNMQFNNRQFESGIKDSVNSLNNLKQGLNLDESVKSLNNLEQTANKFSLRGIAEGVDSIQQRFTTLGIVGMTAIQNITNSVLNAGKNMVSALTIDPIKTGLDEYETKMNAIQTILTNTKSKGTTIDQVNSSLAELNTYADQTIYNFAEMTRNIGTFTAAGIDLKTATSSIKGIANLAAGSGSNAQQASTAMYQLSQALAAGKVSLMDWNSVVNAGMGGELFQKALLNNAKAMGKVVDTGKPFRETLEQGWLTADVLTKTLSQFAEDKDLLLAATQVKTFTQMIDTMKESVQSGWAVSWETILGNKDEAAALFTGINNAFGSIAGASADARNKMLADWKQLGGRDSVINSLANTFKFLGSVITSITAGFREIFPPMTGKTLAEISKNIEKLTKDFVMSDGLAYNLKMTFKGLFALLDIGKQAFVVLAGALGAVIKYLIPVAEGIISITGVIGKFLVGVDESIRKSRFFVDLLQGMGVVLKSVANGFAKVFTSFKSGFAKFDGIDIHPLDAAASGLQKVAHIFVMIGGVIDKAFEGISTAIGNAFSSGGIGNIAALVNGGLFAAILYGLKKFIGSLTNITSNAGGFLDDIKEILDGVKRSLEAYQNSLKADILMKIAMSIGILAASLALLAMINPDRLTSALAAMTVMFVQLFGSMTVFERLMSGSGFKGIIKMTIGMMALSVAVLILASAMKKLSSLDWPGVIKGLVSIAVLMDILAKTSNTIGNSSAGLTKGALGFVIFGAAILILSTAVEKLGKIDLASLAKGLIGVGVLCVELALFLKMADMSGLGVKTGLGFMGLAVGILVLANAVQKFGGIDTGSIIKGLTALGIVLTEIGLFVTLTGDSKRVISTAIGITILAGAMLILAQAIKNMGSMSWDEIAKGLFTLAGSLVVIGGAMLVMQTALPGAAALLIIAGALAILCPVLLTLGSMSLSSIGTSLLTLAGVFTVIGVAGLVLAPIVPIIIGLAAAITLLGIGCLAVGAGILAFSAGLTALSVAGAAGVAALVAVVTGITNLIPYIAKTLAQGVIDFAKVIGDGAPVIGEAIIKVVKSTIETFATIIPMIIDVAMKLITTLLETIYKNMSKIMDVGTKIVVAFIDGLTKNLPSIIEAAYNFIITFIDSLANAIENHKTEMAESIQNLIVAVIDAGISFIASSLGRIEQIGIDLVNGFIEGIKSMVVGAANAAGDLAQSVLDAAKKALGIHSPSKVFRDEVGAMIARGMADGIKLHAKEAKQASSDMAKGVVESAKAWIDDRKYYNQISLEEELYIWEQIQEQYKKGTEERIQADKEAYRVKNEIYKQDYDNAIKWIDNMKYYNKLSLEEELATWQTMQKKYDYGTAEREKADQEVYRIQNDINQKKQESDQAVFDNAVKLIDDRKYYNKLSLTEELAAWQDLQKKYAEGTANREKADREAYRVEQEINEKRKSLEDDYESKVSSVNEKLKSDIKSLNDAYDEALKSKTDSLYSAYGLFDKIQNQTPVSGAQLTANLQSQITAFDDWQTNMTQLSGKGVSEDFIKELKDMGPQSANQIKALNSMTQPELDKYVALWNTKHAEAKTEALTQLESLKTETSTKIQALRAQAQIDLTQLRSDWSYQMSLLNSTSEEQLTNLGTTFDTKVDTLTSDTQKQFEDMTISIKAIDWVSIGNYIVDGMITGIKQKAAELAQIAAETALAALQAAKEALGIASPSKEFAKLGMYSAMGLGVGLQQYSNVAESAASDLGNSAISALKGSISNLSDIIDGSINIEPVIRPVLDLSNIKSGANQINGIFASQTGLNVGSISSKIPNIQSKDSGSTIINQNGSGSQPANISFTQNNYSPQPLSRIEIYRQTKNQISTLKGLVMNP